MLDFGKYQWFPPVANVGLMSFVCLFIIVFIVFIIIKIKCVKMCRFCPLIDVFPSLSPSPLPLLLPPLR